VGGANYRYGSDLLLDAMQQVVARCPTARCHFISGDASYLDQHPARHAPWLTVERRAFHELPIVMQAATVAVVPLRINEYNDLAVPVKLFDYMAFGLPLVVTACRDTAALVQEMQSGLVVADQTADLADGILHLLEDPALARQLGNNGYQAIQNAHSWSHRAAALLQMVAQLEAGSGK
jgi:glycosyltransferase involved in cell wall biosynthesis